MKRFYLHSIPTYCYFLSKTISG